MAIPITSSMKGTFALSQCKNIKTNDTGLSNKQPNPHNILVLNASIKSHTAPISNDAVPSNRIMFIFFHYIFYSWVNDLTLG